MNKTEIKECHCGNHNFVGFDNNEVCRKEDHCCANCPSLKPSSVSSDWETRITMHDPPYEIEIDGRIVDDMELKQFIKSLLLQQNKELVGEIEKYLKDKVRIQGEDSPSEGWFVYYKSDIDDVIKILKTK